MFKEGNLVRLITEDGSGEIMRVAYDVMDGDSVVYCYKMDEDVISANGFDVADIEFVADNVMELKHTPKMIDNINTIDDLTLTDEFNKYIVRVIKELRDKGCEDTIYIEVICTHYRGDDAEITYNVGVNSSYNMVKSDNLRKSAHIAHTRYEEEKALKVKAIPFYKEA